MSAIKPCPFCGALPHSGLDKPQRDQLHGEEYQTFSVWCPAHHARVNGVNKEQAVAAWNTRPYPSVEKVARALWEQATRQTGLEPAKRPMTPNEREAFEPLARAAIAAMEG